MTDIQRYDLGGPFGDPDGARENFNRFIRFESGRAWGGLATQPGDLTVRVIVGGKGSGKTMYMRLLEDGAIKSDDVYVFKQSNQLPMTTTIERFSNMAEPLSDLAHGRKLANIDAVTEADVAEYSSMYEDNLRTEQWQLLWRRAIFRSLASLFYCSAQAPQELTPDSMKAEEFYKNFGRLVPRAFLTPESISNQISDIVTRYPNARQMNDYLNNALWEAFDRTILRNLRKNRPICYFIDAIDEDFRHAPALWLDCQKGLFYQVMRLLRDDQIDSGLHICICIRDLVYSSVLQSSEHGTRYLHVPHIRTLEWDRNSATVFLNTKIERLPDHYRLVPNHLELVTGWLGRATISNVGRGIEEPVLSYILRHSRYLPRDIINIGNALCSKVEEAKAQDRLLDDEEIRQVVAAVAARIGNEAIRICGNHLAASAFPRFGTKWLARDRTESVPSDWAVRILEAMLRELKVDEFGYDVLLAAMDKYQADFSKNAENTKYRQHCIDTILWQHGLLGYKQAGRCIFYSGARDFLLPPDKSAYVLHSCLIDAIGIKPAGAQPIAA